MLFLAIYFFKLILIRQVVRLTLNMWELDIMEFIQLIMYAFLGKT